MADPFVVAIGASAGGVKPLEDVVGGLPAGLKAVVLVVLHVSPYQASALPEILARAGPLPAAHGKDGEKAKAGRVYIAPPDHHLLLDGDRIAVKKGPKENRFRPSIDALFRSVAYTAGPRAIGVVLSGALDDGTSGLWSIKRLGGRAVVQMPNQAQFDTMPLSALQQVEIDHSLPTAEIAPLICKLVAEGGPDSVTGRDEEIARRMKIEIGIAKEDDAFRKGVLELGELTTFTCPECHGALVKIPELNMARYRCHTGHAYTDSSLLEGVMESTGHLLYQVIRSYEESVMVLRDMAAHLHEIGDPDRAAPFTRKAHELEKRSQALHDAALEHESLSGDNLGQPRGQ